MKKHLLWLSLVFLIPTVLLADSSEPLPAADSLFQRAKVFFAESRFDSTLYYCTLALKTDSAFADPLFQRGAAYEKLGRFDEAANDYKLFVNRFENRTDLSRYINYAQARLVQLQPERDITPPQERLLFDIDGDKWKLGFRGIDAEMVLVEYIPVDQKIGNWKKLVSTRYYSGPGNAVQLKKVYDELHDIAFKQCSKSEWRELISGTQNIVYEWNNRSCVSDTSIAEYELARIFISDAGVHRIAFASRNLEEFQAEKEAWLDVFLNTFAAQKRSGNQ